MAVRILVRPELARQATARGLHRAAVVAARSVHVAVAEVGKAVAVVKVALAHVTSFIALAIATPRRVTPRTAAFERKLAKRVLVAVAL